MQGRLTFDEEAHEYRLDGVVLPSVTHILRFLSCDVAAAANPIMRNAAADRGSRIHEACTAYDIDGADTEVDADIVGYVQAYAAFLRDYQINEWTLFEHPLCDPADGFAGTIDRYGDIDGTPFLVDIKTGSKLHMPVHRAQLTAYKHLLTVNGYVVRNVAILHLKRDATYSFRPCGAYDVDARTAFYECFDLNRYLEAKK